MKTSLRNSALSLFAGVCLSLSAGQAVGQVLYSNGPINGTTNAFELDGDIAVGDSFTLASSSKVTAFDFGVWVLKGETPLTVDWSITSQALGGKLYAKGTANLTNVFHNSWTEGHDAYVWNVFDSFASINADLGTGAYWLNLTNGTGDENGLGMYWDINKGVGCGGSDGHGANCPSLARTNLTGIIDSEAFNITGGTQTPEPDSLALLGSGVIGLGGFLKRRWRA